MGYHLAEYERNRTEACDFQLRETTQCYQRYAVYYNYGPSAIAGIGNYGGILWYRIKMENFVSSYGLGNDIWAFITSWDLCFNGICGVIGIADAIGSTCQQNVSSFVAEGRFVGSS